MLRWKRALRTASSERFVAVRDGKEVAVADLHYPANGGVVGTVSLDRAAGWTEEQIPDLLASLDEDMLPAAREGAGEFEYTVMLGEVVGSFEGEREGAEPAKPKGKR